MPIKPAGGGTPATPAPRIRRAAPAATAPAAEQPVAPEAEAAAPAAPAQSTGIVTPRMRQAAQRQAVVTGDAPPPPGDELDSWGHSGAEAEAMAQAQVQQREQAREERRARGYWPRKFELIEPSQRYPDRYQADVIILDVKPTPSFWLHVLQNPRTGRYDVNEPCPKEWDSCCLCPPAGKYDSRFVFLLSVLNITGYTRQGGPDAGTFVPITHELMVVETDNQAFFWNLMRERGEAGLRGLQLTMTRTDRNQPRIGVPSIPNGGEAHLFHTEEAIEKFIRDNGMWRPKMTREGETIDPDEGWLMKPHNYTSFLHRPSGADLRTRYQNGAGAPVGARTSGGAGGADAGEWGNSRYEPGAAGQPAGGAAGGNWGNQVAAGADLDLSDEVPF